MPKDTTPAIPLLMENEETMAGIKTFADAVQLASDAGLTIHSTEEFGDGFKLLSTAEKDRLVKVPFIIIGYKFNEGDNGEFVSIYLVTESDDKFIINDGSTGIRDQCKRYEAAGVTSMLRVDRGLVRSDYEQEYADEKTGELKTRNATTYYLS